MHDTSDADINTLSNICKVEFHTFHNYHCLFNLETLFSPQNRIDCLESEIMHERFREGVRVF